MPYIKPEKREFMDEIIKCMIVNSVKADGDLNYILFKYCKYRIPQNYNSIKNFIGELNETIYEIRRKILAPYEDQKEKENGEI